METLWFWLIGFMLATYVVLDGFDLGAGVLHLFVGRTEEERHKVIHSIGPVWDGNEVWLIASGGALVLAFPTLYAVAFSGFYLPLMIVLWLLMGRALGIEMRHHLSDAMWNQFWDAIFAVSSLLLTIFFGAALGNVVRGVSLKVDGRFFEPLWTDFRVGNDTGILDWYTILIGITALAALSYHGALWLSWRTDQEVQHRSAKAVQILVGPLLLLWILTIVSSAMVQPLLKENFEARTWGVVFPILTFPLLLASFLFHKRKKFPAAFFASCGLLYCMVCSAAAGLYPYVLPARSPELGLTVSQVASPHKSLLLALYWWIPGMIIAAAYAYFVYTRVLRHKKLPHETVTVSVSDV
jgi:cytochrome d ubiquinol oxidase subunit II